MQLHHRILITALLLSASACVGPHPHGMPPGQAKQSLHVHVDGCGHVCIDGVWVIETDAHRHPGKHKGHKH